MSNHLAVLERQDVHPGEDLVIPSDEEIWAIAAGAEDAVVSKVEALGYVPPSIQQSRAEQKAKAMALQEQKRKASLPLAGILRTVGIKPFTPESVKAYQKAMAKPRFQLTEKELPENMLVLLFILGLIVNAVGFWGIGHAISALAGLPFSLGGMGWIPIVSSVIGVHLKKDESLANKILMWLALGSILWLEFVCGSRYEWKGIDLKDYKKDIPRPILETVAEIYTRCPEAKFKVEELTKKPDPFLTVTLDEEKYHIEVWLEPKFNGSRAA